MLLFMSDLTVVFFLKNKKNSQCQLWFIFFVYEILSVASVRNFYFSMDLLI